MKFNPVTGHLFTDNDFLIKRLHCPYGITWDNLTETEKEGQRKCDICNRNIVDTENLTDESVLELISKDASTCLKVDINSSNIRVVIHNAIPPKRKQQ